MRKLMLGNEAIARGLLENGCALAASYPGTPASEILSSLVRMKTGAALPVHAQWAVNEKIAFEIAYAGAMAGLRTAVSMKQVGLNVASDPLMSAAYMGTKGGFIVISADDPGPHSSQTEQDSRLTAMMAKAPVLDPASPAQAKEMTALAYEMSERFETLVMIRPTTRVCHARQDVDIREITPPKRDVAFVKDPARWAATPKLRYQLHLALEKKLAEMAVWPKTAPAMVNQCKVQNAKCKKDLKAVVASGVVAAHAEEIMKSLDLWDVMPFYQVLQPFPLHTGFVSSLLENFEDILILEETMGVMEMQMGARNRVKGKAGGHVPGVGELTPEIIEGILADFFGKAASTISLPAVPGRRPTLCAGCPHRASFFAIKKAAPKGIYTSDIGCYTLGLNLGAVDTVLCMGAAVSQAAGLYHAHKHLKKPPPIVATIGDSTFFHSGVPALIDAVVQDVRFVLVILDNSTTAMTGNQPTPASGFGPDGEPLAVVDLESVVRGCGVQFCREGDPYRLKEFTALVKEALTFSKESGPAVVIARRPCLLDKRHRGDRPEKMVRIGEACDGCWFCVDYFECPALVKNDDEARVTIDQSLCSGCGACVEVCPKKAIEI